jgi:hypothetical protein
MEVLNEQCWDRGLGLILATPSSRSSFGLSFIDEFGPIASIQTSQGQGGFLTRSSSKLQNLTES